MLIKLDKASSSEWEERREISSLDDLVALMDEFRADIVIGQGGTACDYQLHVTIYDDYME